MLVNFWDIIILAEKVGRILKQKKLKLASAESCTGGGMAYLLTSVPGASQWFERGFISYSNASKKKMFNMPETIIREYGAVSRQTAKYMAEGALKNSLADISVSVTGIAGPQGGSDEKPVGLVWFGISFKNPVSKHRLTKTFYENFSGSREEIRSNAVLRALLKILAFLENLE